MMTMTMLLRGNDSVQYVPVSLMSTVIAKYAYWTANQQIANFLRNVLVILYVYYIFIFIF